ncbi:MAG: radical SAM protein [Elusimicrobia bacterium]|nr:radical SAM protein [Elusimicrobiota bacterium]
MNRRASHTGAGALMKIALIKCPFGDIEYPPYNISLLSAILAGSGHEVKNFDFNKSMYLALKKRDRKVRWEPEHQWLQAGTMQSDFIRSNRGMLTSAAEEITRLKPSIAGFSIYQCNKDISLELAAVIKDRDPSITVVFGGPECYLRKNAENLACNRQVDIAVIGEADITLPLLADTLRDGGPLSGVKGIVYKENGLRFTGKGAAIKDIDSLPYPDFSSFAGLYRMDRLPVQSVRGCVNRCNFCTQTALWQKYRQMSAERLFSEISFQLQRHENARFFHFLDPAINFDTGVLRKFCAMMRDNRLLLLKDLMDRDMREKCGIMDIQWAANAYINGVLAPDVLLEMKKAGCCMLTFGIESGSQNVLDRMNKKFAIKEAEEVIYNTYKAGISVAANFMFGFPGETEDDFNDTLRFLKRNAKYISIINPSFNLCDISDPSYIFRHPSEFGICPPYPPDPIFWKTPGNTYKTRFGRYKAFYKLALSLEIPNLTEDANQGYLLKFEDLYLARYYRFEGEFDKALKSYQRLAKRDFSSTLKKIIRKEISDFRDGMDALKASR